MTLSSSSPLTCATVVTVTVLTRHHRIALGFGSGPLLVRFLDISWHRGRVQRFTTSSRRSTTRRGWSVPVSVEALEVLMPMQSRRSRVTRCSAIAIAVVVGGTILVGTGDSVLARRTETPSEPINPVSIVARVPQEDLPAALND